MDKWMVCNEWEGVCSIHLKRLLLNLEGTDARCRARWKARLPAAHVKPVMGQNWKSKSCKDERRRKKTPGEIVVLLDYSIRFFVVVFPCNCWGFNVEVLTSKSIGHLVMGLYVLHMPKVQRQNTRVSMSEHWSWYGIIVVLKIVFELSIFEIPTLESESWKGWFITSIMCANLWLLMRQCCDREVKKVKVIFCVPLVVLTSDSWSR